MGKKKEMIGKKYGRLTVLNEVSKRNKDGSVFYLCRCECGNEKAVSGSALRSGKTLSCGCYNKEITTKADPIAKRPLYGIYHSILDRCNNPNNKSYHNYGGRGINISPLWGTYESFEKWSHNNGYKRGLWLDRIDNDKGYSPDNCRWVTPKVQQNNKRTNIYLKVNEEVKTVTEWAEIYGLNPATVFTRIKLGWNKEDLLIPINKKYSHPKNTN